MNNCSVANGEPERDCQVCGGECPDREKFRGQAGKASLLSIATDAKHGTFSPSLQAQADAEQAAHYAQQEREQKAGERAFAAAAGTEVEVTWGDEYFQPIQFNGMRVGPFKVTTRVREGESIGDALVRVHREVAAAARVIVAEKAREYLETLARVVVDAKNVRV